MSHGVAERLEDIQAAIGAIAAHLQRGPLTDGLVFDAVRVRLVEIVEAVKALPASVTTREAGLPWSDIAQMRELMAHRSFDTAHAVVEAAVVHDLPLLEAAITACRPAPAAGSRLRARVVLLAGTSGRSGCPGSFIRSPA